MQDNIHSVHIIRDLKGRINNQLNYLSKHPDKIEEATDDIVRLFRGFTPIWCGNIMSQYTELSLNHLMLLGQRERHLKITNNLIKLLDDLKVEGPEMDEAKQFIKYANK